MSTRETSEPRPSGESDERWFAEDGETWIELLQSVGPPPATRGGDWTGGDLASDAVPGYVLMEELGRGGQGVVHVALQVATRREVAIKLLREGPLATEAARRRFASEIELAAALDHPGIVRVLEAGEVADGGPFVVIERVTGRTLAEWAKETGASTKERLAKVAEVCEAIEHAHRRGVIHLDLKPANVLVTEEDAVKVLDFGLARATDDESARATGDGVAAGTPAYMAPEQVTSPRSAWDRRTDVHALGALTFELVAGTLPYELGGAPLERLEAIEHAEARRLADVIGAGDLGLSARARNDLDAVLQKAVARDPEERYATAAELGADLVATLDGRAVQARAHESGYRLRRTLTEYAPAVVALALLVIGLVALAVYLYDVSRKEARNAAAAEEAGRLAEERLADVRSLANVFVRDVDPLIRYVPGTSAARELIVGQGLEYLAAMGAAARDDAALAVEIADGYIAISDVLFAKNASSVGDPERAFEALASARALLEEAPDTEEARAALARVWLRTGANELELARRDESRRSLDQALALASSVTNPEIITLELVRIRGRLARWERSYGDRATADALAEEVHAQYGDLLAQFPDDLKLRRDYTIGFAIRARACAERGELDEALTWYARMRDETQALLEADPHALYLQADLALAHEWIGRIHADKGEPKLAIEPLALSIELVEELLLRDGDPFPRRLDLASVVNRLGEAQLAAGDLDGARASFDRFGMLASELRDERPDLPRPHRFVAVALYKEYELRGVLAEKAGDGAREHLVAAREALSQCRETFLEMERTGLLAPSDAGVAAALAEELAVLDARVDE